jgi:hypothetical protein
LKVRVYFLRKTKEPQTSELMDQPFENWMLNNMYDLVWEAEFKNLVTPDIIAMKFGIEPTPFGIAFKKRPARTGLEPGDVVQVGLAHYLRLKEGFRELRL